VNLGASIILPSSGDEGNAGWGDDQNGIDKGDPPVIIDIDIPKSGPDPPKRVLGFLVEEEDAAGPIQTTSAHAYPHSTLKVTVVWSDFPGKTLQNDLDLAVRHLDAKVERHGNQGARNFPLESKEVFDRVNNVEQVVWQNIPPGKTQIVVSGFDITHGPQPWAYAWRLF
jgi:hypothetical protein